MFYSWSSTTRRQSAHDSGQIFVQVSKNERVLKKGYKNSALVGYTVRESFARGEIKNNLDRG